jgi:hypothetical protein
VPRGHRGRHVAPGRHERGRHPRQHSRWARSRRARRLCWRRSGGAIARSAAVGASGRPVWLRGAAAFFLAVAVLAGIVGLIAWGGSNHDGQTSRNGWIAAETATVVVFAGGLGALALGLYGWLARIHGQMGRR